MSLETNINYLKLFLYIEAIYQLAKYEFEQLDYIVLLYVYNVISNYNYKCSKNLREQFIL